MNQQKRIVNANQALQLYDFGNLIQKSLDDWEQKSDTWIKKILLTDPKTKAQCNIRFVVVFNPINHDVQDCYHDETV